MEMVYIIMGTMGDSDHVVSVHGCMAAARQEIDILEEIENEMDTDEGHISYWIESHEVK